MVLSDRSIKEELAKGRIVINPLDESCIQPASVDLHLDKRILEFRRSNYSLVDIHQPMENLTELIEIIEPVPYILQPTDFILGSTSEYIELPDDIVARLEGKSSLGRLGLLIHSTAGYVDPGWKGNLTLEITNVAHIPITLYAGMKISQISFLRLTTPADRPYGSKELGSKYQGQKGPTATRLHVEFKDSSVVSRRRLYQARTPLRGWLIQSEFKGSVLGFSKALGVPVKTVEEWVYGRNKPSPRNQARIFALTQLPEYRPKDREVQQKLL